MILNDRIQALRTSHGMTQQELAILMNVSFQAVSKWENSQSCPDVELLPKLADVFSVTIDSLFGRQNVELQPTADDTEENFHDDDTYHLVLFRGKQLLSEQEVQDLNRDCGLPAVEVQGTIQNLQSLLSVRCGDVNGNVTAGDAANIDCGDVSGNITAGDAPNINCYNVGGNITTGDAPDIDFGGSADISCGDAANITCGNDSNITCGDAANVTCGSNADITCGDGANIITCGDGADITCGDGAVITRHTGAHIDFMAE